MTDRDDIKGLIGYIKLAYPNFNPTLEGSPNIIDVWYDLLGDLPLDTLKLAVKSCCTEPDRAFAPSPGEIRGAIAKMNTSNLPLAGEAWGEVIQYIVTKGCHGEVPEFSYPIIKQAVQIIGMENIGMSDDVMVERAHFLKIYEQLRNREIVNIVQLPAITAYEENRQIETKNQVKRLIDKLEEK